MAVILAYGSPSLGHLFPICALLCELAGRGHQVHLRTLAAEVISMRKVGFLAEPVDPRIEAIAGQDWLACNALGVLKMSIDVLCRRAVLEVDDLNAAIDRVELDVLIVDANCWGAMSMADAGDIPWLVFSPFTPYLRSRGVPPFGPGLRPLPGLLGDIRDASMRPFVTHLFDRRSSRASMPFEPNWVCPGSDRSTSSSGGRRCCWRSGVSRSSIRIPDGATRCISSAPACSNPHPRRRQNGWLPSTGRSYWSARPRLGRPTAS